MGAPPPVWWHLTLSPALTLMPRVWTPGVHTSEVLSTGQPSHNLGNMRRVGCRKHPLLRDRWRKRTHGRKWQSERSGEKRRKQAQGKSGSQITNHDYARGWQAQDPSLSEQRARPMAQAPSHLHWGSLYLDMLIEATGEGWDFSGSRSLCVSLNQFAYLCSDLFCIDFIVYNRGNNLNVNFWEVSSPLTSCSVECGTMHSSFQTQT